MNSKKRIFVTGGHFTPALAVIEQLEASGDWEIFYVGRKFSMEDDRAPALEYLELASKTDIRYLVINAGRLQRKFFVQVFQSIKALFRVNIGFLQSLYWLIRFRPEIILSFGGYVALPIVVIGWLLRIPIVTHEQTVVSGLSNRLIAQLADEILVSWPESLRHFPAGRKVILSGNPIRPEIIEALNQSAGQKKTKPNDTTPTTIYITGGNQGSRVINQVVLETLPVLLEKHNIIHQTGDSQTFLDFEALESRRQELPKPLQKRYSLHKFLDEKGVAEAFERALFVISRSGANIVTELMAGGLPAIFVPIPWSDSQEQEQNARMMADRGAAIVLPQSKLSAATLLSSITEMESNLKTFQEAARQCQKYIRLNAAKTIVTEIEKIVAEEK